MPANNKDTSQAALKRYVTATNKFLATSCKKDGDTPAFKKASEDHNKAALEFFEVAHEHFGTPTGRRAIRDLADWYAPKPRVWLPDVDFTTAFEFVEAWLKYCDLQFDLENVDAIHKRLSSRLDVTKNMYEFDGLRLLQDSLFVYENEYRKDIADFRAHEAAKEKAARELAL